MTQAILALEDGSLWYGRAVGRTGRVSGEVVFNTAMTGYTEVLSDPSYAGQIVTMTYPLIGNYGTNSDDYESTEPRAKGFIVRELCALPSSWRSETDANRFLDKWGIVGIEGVDTRSLTRRLRERGTMRGTVSTAGDVDPDELVAQARSTPTLSEQDLVREISTPTPYTLGDGSRRITVLDLGCKRNIPVSLARRDCRVTVLPGWSSPQEIMASNPDGIVISNGPGDPKAVGYAADAVREVLGAKPMLGICLGHQILALALGGDTFRLKYGHRGANHPVKDLATGRVYITSQNHGYAVDADSFGSDVIVSHQNVNDGTVEGLRHRTLPVASVQYHPEASPGPEDSQYLFDDFLAGLSDRAG